MDLSMAGENSSLTPALLRLIEVIDDENSVLRRQEIVSHAAYTDRKNQALRELMAAQRRHPATAPGSGLQPLLCKLSEALEDNCRLLKLHIAAVGEISDVIVGSLRDAESDGTYSRGVPRRR
ncbi:MAG: hypothetical protein U1E16_07180 [Hyphomicrobiales bacterium]|uniref:hypothetical protein n=1 Tax=Aestuariivirga sp. TaxID=2650926 RepID=UPI0035B15C7D